MWMWMWNVQGTYAHSLRGFITVVVLKLGVLGIQFSFRRRSVLLLLF